MRWPTALLFTSLVCSALADSNDAPSLKIMARSSVYNVGEKKGIYCEKSNIEDEIEWRSPSGQLIQGRSAKNTRVYVEKKSSEPNLVALIIHSTKLTDSGNWTCQAGEIKEHIKIIVGEKVIMAKTYEEIHADEGRTVKLNCEAKGDPAPLVQWYRDGTQINFIEDDSKYSVKTKGDNYVLEIKRLTHADAGEYMCKVTQKTLSHYTHKIVNLTVHHKPILFNPKTKDIYVIDPGSKWRTEETFAVYNETKNITCSALAYPPPIFTWFKRNAKNYDVPIQDTDLISSSDPMSSTLTLKMLDKDDMGMYKCTASNEKGTISTIYDVSPGLKPMPPESIEFHSSNASHIVFNVTCGENCTYRVDGNEVLKADNLPIIGYLFGLVPVQEEYPADWEHSTEIYVDIIDPLDTIFEVGPLANSTEFYVRVSSVNLAGFSDWLEMEKVSATTNKTLRLITSLLPVAIALFVTMCN